jgi:hypothetical protein
MAGDIENHPCKVGALGALESLKGDSCKLANVLQGASAEKWTTLTSLAWNHCFTHD